MRNFTPHPINNMFKTMYTFWLKNNISNTTSLKLNVWSIDSIRVFNILASSELTYLIYNLNTPKLQTIKTVRYSYSFESIVTLFMLSSLLSSLLYIILST
jgi:hypothetical protein